MQILILCSDVNCSLHETGRLLEVLQDAGYPLPGLDEAKQSTVPCFICNAVDPPRDGTLIYLPLEDFAVVPSELSSEGGMTNDPHWQVVPRKSSAVPSAGDGVASLDSDAAPRNGVPVGVVLDTIPYGGYLLRYGDKDAGKQYGPRQDGLPLQDPAKPNYILQLQDDLLFLAYWNTLRAIAPDKPAPGEYHYSMIGAVLALKEDLTTFYGVAATTDLGAATISLDKGSKLNLRGLDIPIYYDRSLRNPIRAYFHEVLDPIREALSIARSVAKAWQKALAGQKKGVFTKASRKILADLVVSTEVALSLCNQAIKTAHGLGGNWAAPSSAEALLGDPVFEIDRKAGKACWTGFQAVVVEWEAMRNPTHLDPVSECTASLNTFVPATDELPEVVACCEALRDRYAKCFVALDAAIPLGWEILGAVPEALVAYQAKIREYATVDWATAAYIHAMRNYIPIGTDKGALGRAGGVLAFRFPDDGVDKNAPPEMRDVYDMAIAEAKIQRVPPQLVIERFAGESGFEHTYTVQRFAATKAHKGVQLTKMGTDFANWGPSGHTKSTFAFSEMFTRGPGDWERGGGRGYLGPIIMSRGWGVSQTTVGTFLAGVTPKTRVSEYEGLNWILGIPVSKSNAAVEIPVFIGATDGIIKNGVGILANKYKKNTKTKGCSYVTVGGAEHDCHNCLKRFDPSRDFVRVKNSYRLDVDDDRFQTLIGKEPFMDKKAREEQAKELPCSWLTAIMRYAGTGNKAFARLRSTAKLVARPPSGTLFEEYIEKLSKEAQP